MRSMKIVLESGQELQGPFDLEIEGWSEDDYFRMAPEDRPCEFVDGRVVVHSPVKSRHDELVGFLRFLLQGFVHSRRLGTVRAEPFPMRLRPGLDRAPDLFVILGKRSSRITEDYLDGPADLVVEVVSRSSRHRDLVEKPREYAEHGVGEYWAVDYLRERVHVHRLVESEGLYECETVARGRISPRAIAGLNIDVSWFWQKALPDELRILTRMLSRRPLRRR